jgi:HK97 gp10 family phage protein
VIDFGEILQGVYEGAVQGLTQGAQVVLERAKARAPVRKIFAGAGYGVRTKTAGEIEAVRGARDAAFKAGGPPTVIRPERLGEARIAIGKKPPTHWRERRLAAASRLLSQYDTEMSRRRAGFAPQKTMLSRRGAHEVRSGRANFATWEHLKVGGRLRGEIYATDPSVSSDHAEAWVISPTSYGKYMEFGTRHAAAHPFLRPAAEESRSEVAALVAEAIRGALPHGSTNIGIEIVVRL